MLTDAETMERPSGYTHTEAGYDHGHRYQQESGQTFGTIVVVVGAVQGVCCTYHVLLMSILTQGILAFLCYQFYKQYRQQQQSSYGGGGGECGRV